MSLLDFSWEYKMNKRLICFLMAFTVILLSSAMQVSATTISDAKQQKKETENKLSDVQADIDELEGGLEAAEEEIEEIDNELVNLLMTVDILKDDISDKESEIRVKQIQYDAAQNKESEQLEAMKRRIKFMYEKGESSYVQMFLQAKSIAELLNKMDYTEKLYEYDRQLLLEYQNTKQEVFEAKMSLEEEKSEMEEIKADMEEQSASLQALLDEKKENLADYDAKLSAAKKKANEYQNEIKKQAAQIKQMEAEEAARKKAEEEARKKAEEEAKKKAEEAAAAGRSDGITVENDAGSDNSSSNTSENTGGNSSSGASAPSGGSSGGSGKGQEIANYACQFVGGPYVAGGTSLTEGCDCSGFTSGVFAHFGISLPRSSYAQSTYGREVSVSEIQPGDVLYYGGHVAIYVGNGMIVHASTAATGIKYSSAYYRTIITARRFY